jgi:hypothetical protein
MFVAVQLLRLARMDLHLYMRTELARLENLMITVDRPRGSAYYFRDLTYLFLAVCGLAFLLLPKGLPWHVCISDCHDFIGACTISISVIQMHKD